MPRYHLGYAESSDLLRATATSPAPSPSPVTVTASSGGTRTSRWLNDAICALRRVPRLLTEPMPVIAVESNPTPMA